MPGLLKRKSFLVLLVVGALAVLVVVWRLRGGEEWSPNPRLAGESLIFDEHLTLVPASIYTPEEKAVMGQQIDQIRFVTDAKKRAEFRRLFSFGQAVSAGQPAPDFELTTTAGQRLALEDLRGRIAVFMFAAMTCPPARRQVPRFEALQRKYDPADVSFFLIYSRERHAGESGFPEFEYASTDAEKRAYAAMLAERTTLPIAVDGIAETVLDLYGGVPNPAYVVDRSGTIVFRSTWADSRKIEQVVDALLAWEGEDLEAGWR